MKGSSLILVCFLFFAACSNSNNENRNTEKKDSIQTSVDNSVDFLELFETIDPVNLHVFPPRWDSNGKVIPSPFVGKAVDVFKFAYVNDSHVFPNIEACRAHHSNIYAIGRFEINKEYLGLLIRQHSQYEESIVQLVLWSKKKKCIYEGLDLADSFGDEGWVFELESWIKDYEPNGKLTIVSRKQDYTPKDEEAKAYTVTDTLKIHTLKKRKFTTKSLNLQDTVNYVLTNWMEQYTYMK